MNTELYTHEDYNTTGMVVINGFDDAIYNTGLINLQKELDNTDISIGLHIKKIDDKQYIYCEDAKVTLSIKNDRITPMIGTLYLRGINRKSVLWYIIKHSENRKRFPSDKYEIYIVDWNNNTYEVGLSKDTNACYMQRFDEKKWENIYYRNLPRSTHQYSKLEATENYNEVYGDICTSMGSVAMDYKYEQLLEAYSIIDAYKDIPEFKSLVESEEKDISNFSDNELLEEAMRRGLA